MKPKDLPSHRLGEEEVRGEVHREENLRGVVVVAASVVAKVAVVLVVIAVGETRSHGVVRVVHVTVTLWVQPIKHESPHLLFLLTNLLHCQQLLQLPLLLPHHLHQQLQ